MDIDTTLSPIPAAGAKLFGQTDAGAAGWIDGDVAAGIFNVKAYGALGNGTNDDSEEIQAAIDAAHAVKGAVYLPSGIYYCTKSLIIPSYVKIFGDGRGKTIIRNPASVTPGSSSVTTNTIYATIGSSGATNVEFSGFTIDHQTNSTQTNGIVLVPDGFDGSTVPTSEDTPTTYAYIHEVEVLGYDSHQYLIWNFFAKHTRIFNCNVDGGVTTHNASSSQDGIEVYGGEDVQVMFNTVTNIGSTAIWTFSTAEEVSIRDSVWIDNNYIDTARYGIGGMAASSANGIKYRGNILKNLFVSGISFTAPGAIALNDLEFSNNTIRNATTLGISLANTGASLLVTSAVRVVGNVVQGTSGASAVGIQVSHFSNTVIFDNVIDGGHIGINYVSGGATPAGNSKIAGNTISNTQKNGMTVYNGPVTISGNSIRGWNLSNSTYDGIHLLGPQKVTVFNNTFKFGGSSETKALGDEGWGGTAKVWANILEYTPGIATPLDFSATGTINF